MCKLSLKLSNLLVKYSLKKMTPRKIKMIINSYFYLSIFKRYYINAEPNFLAFFYKKKFLFQICVASWENGTDVAEKVFM